MNTDRIYVGVTKMRVAVGIATCGRPSILKEALASVLEQTRKPDSIIISYSNESDIFGINKTEQLTLVKGKTGLTRQRNEILKRAQSSDIIIFIDDDLLMSKNYVAEICSVMSSDQNIVVATGDLIADGSRNAGYTVSEAQAMIAADTMVADTPWVDASHGYGCNMAIRIRPAEKYNIKFDENLPLYGWSEDMDFTLRLGRFGKIVKVSGARGVHLGDKAGRTSGYKLGYSQVANPIYLYRKGSYDLKRTTHSVLRNLLMNTLLSTKPESYVDRRGRLVGNFRAFLDLLQGRMNPNRILEF